MTFSTLYHPGMQVVIEPSVLADALALQGEDVDALLHFFGWTLEVLDADEHVSPDGLRALREALKATRPKLRDLTLDQLLAELKHATARAHAQLESTSIYYPAYPFVTRGDREADAFATRTVALGFRAVLTRHHDATWDVWYEALVDLEDAASALTRVGQVCFPFPGPEQTGWEAALPQA
jgi:hypothetical protein